MKKDFDAEKQKEEIKKKYEYYKKMFITEKTEKEAKIKELAVLKDNEGPMPEVKETRAKYEALKLTHQREYTLRKEKEQKIEVLNQEIQMKN